MYVFALVLESIFFFVADIFGIRMYKDGLFVSGTVEIAYCTCMCIVVVVTDSYI